MKPLNKCPRCKKKWSVIHSTGYYCEECKFGNMAHLYYLVIDENHMLQWNTLDQECIYMNNNLETMENSDCSETILPWLPLIITHERVKLLITFS
jgi:hypothetical protein